MQAWTKLDHVIYYCTMAQHNVCGFQMSACGMWAFLIAQHRLPTLLCDMGLHTAICATWGHGCREKHLCAFSRQQRKLSVCSRFQDQLTVQGATLNFTIFSNFDLRHRNFQCRASTVIGQTTHLHRYGVNGLTNEPTGTALNWEVVILAILPLNTMVNYQLMLCAYSKAEQHRPKVMGVSTVAQGHSSWWSILLLVRSNSLLRDKM